MSHAYPATLQTFKTATGKVGRLYSLPALTQQFPDIVRLPISLRLILESVLRHCDGHEATPEQVAQLARWHPNAARTEEIAFVVSRVVLQDFTGVPLLVDLAAMRSVAVRLGQDPARIEPLVPVDLVVDHSIMVDHYGHKDSLDLNMQLEFQRNHERYAFLKWGTQAFKRFRVVPPGFGIVHQVNLEYLARGVHKTEDEVYYPDTLVGTDSHTTMINGMGVVGWGVGGIEAEAAMLGQPVYLQMPDVVGCELRGKLSEGVTATDLVLTITELLRKHKVVGKFVEFFGEGARTLGVPDRATLANMAPEYGATMGYFPVDEKTLDYFKGTGRTQDDIETFEAYYKAQGLFGIARLGQIDYSSTVMLDLGRVMPCVAGPKRPQDKIPLGQVAAQFTELFSKPSADNGFDQPAHKLTQRFATKHPVPEHPAHAPAESLPHTASLSIKNGDVLIAAITSCTNTSNPSVLLAAGLLAKKAVEAGLQVAPHIKTSLAPGSRIVTEYLTATGLLPHLEKLGFALAGYGCTTCIGNAGDLTPELNAVILENDLVCAAVLSGNRNFEARIHPSLKANFLASPPLVVAYALAGTVLCDLLTQPLGLGQGPDGMMRDVYLRDIWPSSDEVHTLLKFAMNGKAYRENYARIASHPGPLWENISGVGAATYAWPPSTYISEPPFFEHFGANGVSRFKGIKVGAPDTSDTCDASDSKAASVTQGARIIALFGDSITTDHISPAGSIPETSPAGQWLLAHGVQKVDFNSYGARRGNGDVMVRGTFANVRIKNLMLPPKADGSRQEGGLTLYYGASSTASTASGASSATASAPPSTAPSRSAADRLEPVPGEPCTIFDAATRYLAHDTPTVVFAGQEYGTGSSRDWAAKGTLLLGIKAVVAQSFERIHRSNLVGMGVLPLQFRAGESWQTWGLNGSEVIDIETHPDLAPRSEATLTVRRSDGTHTEHTVLLRMDTQMDVAHYRAGGIMPFVLHQLLDA